MDSERERQPDGHTPDPEDQGPAASGALDQDSADGSDDPAGTHTALPPKVESWRRRSAAGAILTGFALGLQEALEKHKDEPSIVMETFGEPPDDLPVEADFEYGRPRQSVVQIRPWLLPDSASGAADTPGANESGGRDDDSGRGRKER